LAGGAGDPDQLQVELRQAFRVDRRPGALEPLALRARERQPGHGYLQVGHHMAHPDPMYGGSSIAQEPRAVAAVGLRRQPRAQPATAPMLAALPGDWQPLS